MRRRKVVLVLCEYVKCSVDIVCCVSNACICVVGALNVYVMHSVGTVYVCKLPGDVYE